MPGLPCVIFKSIILIKEYSIFLLYMAICIVAVAMYSKYTYFLFIKIPIINIH